MKDGRGRQLIRTAIPIAVFLVALPFSVFLGIVLVLGHGGYFPYVSAWLDRLAFAVLALGIPALLALMARRLVGRRASADAPIGDESVADAVKNTFLHEQQAAVLAELSRYGAEPHEKECDRVRLAILALSKGNLDEIARLVEAAKKDYRDILMWAENEERDEG